MTFEAGTWQDTQPRQQTGYVQSNIHSAPLDYLLPSAAARLAAVSLRARDLNAIVPKFSEISEAQLAVTRHQQRINDLTRHPADGGRGLGSDAPQVISEQRLLDRASAELAQLKSLEEARAARWNTCGQVEQSVINWLRSGVPGDCELVAVDDPPVAELLKKGESTNDAVLRYRHKLKERAADLQTLKSVPYPSREAKAVARDQINSLADAAEPDVSRVVKFLEPVQFVMTRSRTLAASLDPKLPASIVHSESPDAVGLIAVLFRQELIKKIETLIDRVADDAAAIPEKERQEQEAKISAEILLFERSEVALIRHAELNNGEIIDYRGDTAPQAVLGVQLRSRPNVNGSAGTSFEPMAWPISIGS